jgi:hypothetical protein
MNFFNQAESFMQNEGGAIGIFEDLARNNGGITQEGFKNKMKEETIFYIF